ncbi:MAG: lamin tail domain-containing protein [Bacteroidales bacterium]
MKTTFTILFSALVLAVVVPLRAQVVINEYSASNLATVTDNYNKYEDWVELYNPSSTQADISGYFLSDRINNPTKWQFPDGVVIPAQGFLRIWTSGRDLVSGGHYHTNYRMTQTGDNPEYVVLSYPDGSLAEAFHLEITQRNHSRGRQPNGSETWKIFTSPTPGSSNNNATGYLAYAAKPEMIEIAGFYDNPLSISITTDEPNSAIYFTTNGHEPNTSSTQYTQPVPINNTRILIARTFSNNPQILPSLLEFNTYFIGVTHTLGVMSISAAQIQQLLNGNASLRPFGTFEYFNADGIRTTYGYGEYNEHGQDSWVHPQRSIDYITRDECGYNYAIREQLIPFTDRDEFQRIIIRAQGDDNYPGIDTSAHLRDLFIQNFADLGGMNLDGRKGQQGLMYANGDYWGVYGFREKVDHDFSSYYYNQGRYDLYFLKIWGGSWAQYGGQAAFNDWYDLRGFILNNDMAIQSNFEYVKTRYDYESLVDYIIINSFVVCTDWINWNVGWWRGLNPEGGIQRWRYTLWDEDATFNHYINYTGVPGTHPYVSPCYPEGITADPGQHIAVLNKLMMNPEFKRYHVSRYIDLYNTVFRPDNLINYLNTIEAEMIPEMPMHVARWGGSMTQWQNNVQKIRNFINARYSYLPNGLKTCYNLTGPYELNLSVSPPGAGKIRINSIHPEEQGWGGLYFGGIDTELEAYETNPQYVFDHWQLFNNVLSPSDTSKNVTVNLTVGDFITAVFVPKVFSDSLVINEINYRSHPDVYPRDWVEFYNPHPYPLDITGWIFKDGNDNNSFIFQDGTVMPPLGYLVLCRDTAAFKSVFPFVENYTGDMNFGFSSEGELLRLYNSEEVLIDTVHYGVDLPWPPEPNGNGPTLELKKWDYDNALPESWTASIGYGTPGEQNGYIVKTYENEPKELAFTIYPNPVREEAILQVTSQHLLDHAEVEIFNSFGKRIIAMNGMENNRLKIDCRDLSKGLYLCKLTDKEQKVSQTIKFMVE